MVLIFGQNHDMCIFKLTKFISLSNQLFGIVKTENWGCRCRRRIITPHKKWFKVVAHPLPSSVSVKYEPERAKGRIIML